MKKRDGFSAHKPVSAASKTPHKTGGKDANPLNRKKALDVLEGLETRSGLFSKRIEKKNTRRPLRRLT